MLLPVMSQDGNAHQLPVLQMNQDQISLIILMTLSQKKLTNYSKLLPYKTENNKKPEAE
jgi:hypothetical protein